MYNFSCSTNIQLEAFRVKKEKRVLVVDDDEDIRQIILMILESEGYTVLGLDTGKAVFETVEQIKPDLVLLDVMLGDSDGRDICRALKNQYHTSNIPVIMISASHNWQPHQQNYCDADCYLSKPFDIEDLVNHVRRYAA